MKPKLFTALKGYNREQLLKDVMSGLIVAVVALPLAIAFAIASGLSPEVGLATAIIGGVVVSLLGGNSVQIGGPAGAFIVIIYGIVQHYGIEGLLVTTSLAGILLIIMGVMKMGGAIKFIPYPIIIGFTSGMAVIILTTQIQDLFGLTVEYLPADFIGRWIAYGGAIDTINYMSLLFGVVTILIIVYAPRFTHPIPGSLVAIVVMTLVGYLLREYSSIDSIETIGDRYTIGAALPTPRLININFTMVRELLPTAFTIALLCAIESLLSATVSDGMTGDKHDSNMELVAQGSANIVVTFFGGMPVTGALARTMTNINSGGRTPIAGVVHAGVLLLILLFLSPLTRYIPMATLAGVLVVVSYNMCEWRTFRKLLKGTKSDVSVLLTTFFLAVIFDISIAIIIGILLAMLLFMRRIAEVTNISVVRDSLDLTHEGENAYENEVLDVPQGVEIYQIDGPFFFGLASKFDAVMNRIGETAKVRIIRMRKVSFMDSTGLHNLSNLITLSQEAGIKVILSGVNENVRKSLTQGGIDQLVGEEAICDNIHTALEVARRELK